MKELTTLQLRQRKTYKDGNMIRISTPDGPFSMQIEYLGHDIIFAGVPNDEGSYTTPSVVHIDDQSQVIVGAKAKRLGIMKPKNTFL